MYVYVRSEPGLYTVGHYDPNGKFISESDHKDKSQAAQRVAWLNGSTSLRIDNHIQNYIKWLEDDNHKPYEDENEHTEMQWCGDIGDYVYTVNKLIALLKKKYHS